MGLNLEFFWEMIMSVVERDDYECCGEVEGGERREALADWGWKGK